jgi:protein-S-isoprenylcysteine O-methyltransferase Ste14
MSNVVLRTVVWIGAIAGWLRLRRPVGIGWTHVSWRPTAVLGALVAMIGIAGFVWSATALASEIPNTLNPRARLLTRGPFAYVRNPLYLSAGGVVVGLTTMYGLWQTRDAIIWPMLGVSVHLFVVYLEEPRTRERLGPLRDLPRHGAAVAPPLLSRSSTTRHRAAPAKLVIPPLHHRLWE